jgi:hypothetical protein
LLSGTQVLHADSDTHVTVRILNTGATFSTEAFRLRHVTTPSDSATPASVAQAAQAAQAAQMAQTVQAAQARARQVAAAMVAAAAAQQAAADRAAAVKAAAETQAAAAAKAAVERAQAAAQKAAADRAALLRAFFEAQKAAAEKEAAAAHAVAAAAAAAPAAAATDAAAVDAAVASDDGGLDEDTIVLNGRPLDALVQEVSALVPSLTDVRPNPAITRDSEVLRRFTAALQAAGGADAVKFLVHGTPEHNVDSILQSSLRGSPYGNRRWFTSCVRTARNHVLSRGSSLQRMIIFAVLHPAPFVSSTYVRGTVFTITEDAHNVPLFVARCSSKW